MSHPHFQIWNLCFPRTFERLHVDAISYHQIHARRAKIPQKQAEVYARLFRAMRNKVESIF